MSDLSKQGGGRKPFSRGGKRGKKERKKKKPTLLWHLRGVGPGSINRPGQRTRAVAGQKEVTATSRHSFFSFFLPAPRPPFLLSTRPIFAKIHGALHEKRALAAKQGQRGGREGGGRGVAARGGGGGGLCLREKLIPNDATRNGKKIFCREVRAPSLV